MMISAEQLIEQIEAAGGTLTVDGEKIHCLLPEDATPVLDDLRARKPQILSLLRQRLAIPPMPQGVRLIAWNLKEPPVAIDVCSVVIEPELFARATLGELREHLMNPKRKYGWTIPQLIDRLAQVGVIVELERSKNPISAG